MIRTLAAMAALATLALAGAAPAQTWGQPVYRDAYERPVGGTPLSEVETRSYAGTGRWADGYADRPRVHVPGPGDDRDHRRRGGHDRYGQGYAQRRPEPSSRAGYRDEWGYNDDRPASARGRSDGRRPDWRDRDCGCSDVYLYDR